MPDRERRAMRFRLFLSQFWGGGGDAIKPFLFCKMYGGGGGGAIDTHVAR